eukprot:4874330-Prymnesium_polylepis.1
MTAQLREVNRRLAAIRKCGGTSTRWPSSVCRCSREAYSPQTTHGAAENYLAEAGHPLEHLDRRAEGATDATVDRHDNAVEPRDGRWVALLRLAPLEDRIGLLVLATQYGIILLLVRDREPHSRAKRFPDRGVDGGNLCTRTAPAAGGVRGCAARPPVWLRPRASSPNFRGSRGQ